MISDEDFLRAIRADPADDAPWLIYADWLEERGDPRAALYRNPRRTNGLGMKFVLVPRGTFSMGDRGEQRQVDVPHEFYIGAFPVTQGQWQAIMGNNPSYFSRGGDGADEVTDITDADLGLFPAEMVSWDDVQEFLKWLNAREKGRGFVYRLPAEVEWEYAFYFAQPTNDLSSEQANFNGNDPVGNSPDGMFVGRTTKVGSYPPNRLGLYDMYGNVWEWCADQIQEVWGLDRVIRGGTWDGRARHCKESDRRGYEPSDRGNFLGFRLVAFPSGE